MDREEDRTDGPPKLGEVPDLDRLELQTDGRDASRLLRVLNDPLVPGGVREKLRFREAERND